MKITEMKSHQKLFLFLIILWGFTIGWSMYGCDNTNNIRIVKEVRICRFDLCTVEFTTGEKGTAPNTVKAGDIVKTERKRNGWLEVNLDGEE